jgi:TnpA family transposase
MDPFFSPGGHAPLESYLLDPDELALVLRKQGLESQFIFAVMLKFFESEKRFPTAGDSFPEAILQQIAYQVGLPSHVKLEVDESKRTYRRFCREIRQHFGYRECSLEDQKSLVSWLIQAVFPSSPTWEQTQDQAYTYLRERKIEPLAPKPLQRVLRSAHHQFETHFFKTIEGLLSADTKKALDALLEKDIPEADAPKTKDVLKLSDLKKETAELKLESILDEIKKYQHLCSLNLPQTLETLGSRTLFQKYYERVQTELPSHLKAHASPLRYAYLALFCSVRSQMIADTLTDLLLQFIHRIQKKAEKQVREYIFSEVTRVNGKFDTLALLAQTSYDNPLGIIQEEIYPHVPRDKLKDIATDLSHRGKWYKNQLKSKELSLYSSRNRRIVWALMDALSLASDPVQGPCLDVLKALAWLKERLNTPKIDLKPLEAIPFENVLSPSWLPFIKRLEPSKQVEIFNIYAYELALFERIGVELGCKNIWVEGAYRYRNPLHDLPKDFEANKTSYLKLLDLPECADLFTESLKKQLEEGLEALNHSILENPKVKIYNRKKKGSIKVSPSAAQAEPAHLGYLKQEIKRRWEPLSLMDILQESDYRIGFTKRFQSTISRSALTEATLKRRLLLCLFGLGTNAGLKRMSAGAGQETYSDLRYVKRCFMGCQTTRESIQDVVNAVLSIRDPKIWGTQTTGSACDSKKISVWDQNLMAEWHARYQGRGVMIYWHVDKKSACIYSHLKTCSSSEVGAMMKGFLNHDTNMEMNQLYVDTHGQSAIGFAFSHLFHFDLLPRLKNINQQKLFRASTTHFYPNLTAALAAKAINWKVIREAYEEILKIVAGLKTRTVEPEVIIKRFGADNEKNPVYQALLEIGKAVRTLFLCKYLASEELRIEIHDSLNVVERVNSIMGFIFYGKLGEISSNNREDQELSLLCLHLLQVCMVYINTLMIQEVLGDPLWQLTLTTEDRRALTPLIHTHITPYGFFVLDISHRIALKAPKNENNHDRSPTRTGIRTTHPRSGKSQAIREAVA